MNTLLSALRALFVLGCLVMVPLMAVFGTSLPATLIAAISGQDSASTPAPAPKSSAAPLLSSAATALPKTPLPSESPVRPVAGQAWPGTETASAQIMPIPVSPAGNLPNFGGAAHGNEGPGTNGAGPAQSPFPPASSSVPQPVVPPMEAFSGYKARLQELGAKFYKLETSGDQNELFHFICQIRVAANAAPPQVFEATDADPIQAVARVVHQVEDFRSGRLQ